MATKLDAQPDNDRKKIKLKTDASKSKRIKSAKSTAAGRDKARKSMLRDANAVPQVADGGASANAAVQQAMDDASAESLEKQSQLTPLEHGDLEAHSGSSDIDTSRFSNSDRPEQQIRSGSGVYDKEANSRGNPTQKGKSDSDSAASKEASADTDSGQKSLRNEAEKLMTGAAQKQEEKLKKIKEKQRRGLLKGTRTKIALGVGAIGAAAAIFSAIAFLPAALTEIVKTKLYEAFMDRVGYAFQQRFDHYVGKYVANVISPTLDECGTVRSRSCSVINEGSGFTTRLYRSWRDNNIEERLFNKHGIEFEKNANSPQITIKQHGRPVGTYGPRESTKVLSGLIETETFAEGFFDRLYARGIVKRKYGARGCIIHKVCRARDGLDTSISNAKSKILLRLYGNVAGPANSRTGAFLICSRQPNACTPEKLTNDMDLAAREALNRLDIDVAELGRISKSLGNHTLSNFLIDEAIEKIVAKIGFATSAKFATSTVPIIGQVYAGLELLYYADMISRTLENGTLSRFIRERNLAAYTEYAHAMRVLDDEVLSDGKTLGDAGGVFSIMNGMAASRLWQDINGIDQLSRIICKDGFSFTIPQIIPGIPPFELSQDDTVLEGPDDPRVCPNKLVVDSGWIQTAEGITQSAPYQIFIESAARAANADDRDEVSQALELTIGTIDSFIDLVGETAIRIFAGTLRRVPAVGEIFAIVADTAKEEFAELTAKLLEFMFPLAVNALATGSELLDQYAGGVDAMANLILKGFTDPENDEDLGLGAPALDAPAEEELGRAIEEQRREEMKSKSIFARYFDINDHQSLAGSLLLRGGTTVAMAAQARTIPMPSLSSLFGSLATTFGFSQPASAASFSGNRGALFGITQYGFAPSDRAITIDADLLTDDQCQTFAMERADSIFENTATGEMDFAVSDPCRLDAAVVDSALKRFNLDSQADIDAAYADIDGTSAVSGSGGGLGGGAPLDPSGCPTAPVGQDETVVVRGIRVHTCIQVNLERMLAAAAADGINLGGWGWRDHFAQHRLRREHGCAYDGSGVHTPNEDPSQWVSASACSPPTARPGSSQHERGLAIDFTCNGIGMMASGGRNSPCFRWLGGTTGSNGNARFYGFLNLPSEPWHWSTTGR